MSTHPLLPVSTIKALAIALTAFSLIALAPPPLAHAASKDKKTATSTSTPAPAKKRTVRVKPSQNNSGETAAEREKRLYRECQGMPNAGACLGYTRR